MSEIVVGGYVRVTKGTPVYEGYGFDDPKPASRDQVVKVKCIDKVHSVYVRDIGEIPGDDLRYVEWSGKKTLIGYVTSVEEPAKAKAPKKERAITKQQQMVKGSIWRLTEDVTFTYNDLDPRWSEAERQFHAAKRSAAGVTGTLHDLHAALHAKGVFEHSAKPYVKLAAGTEIKVTGKLNRGNPIPGASNASGLQMLAKGRVWMLYDGFCVPCEVDGQPLLLPYSQLEPFVVAVDIPTTFQYVLRDRETGLLMESLPSSFGFRNDDGEWISPRTIGEKVKMTDRFMKAKRFDDMSRVKQSILGWTGYYHDMPGAEDRPEWAGNEKVMDLPETWEAVKFDKLSKKEVETVDLQDWYKRTWKLRALTIQFGSPVRKLFNDIEKRDELDKYQGMVVLRAKVDKDWTIRYEDELRKEDIMAFEEIAETMGLGKGQFRRAKDSYCIAMAVATANDALYAKLAYAGDAPIAALDIQTMREIVSEDKTGP
jgi:hypothetical protein